MGKKRNIFKKDDKYQSMIDKSNESRNSVTGYMEQGNPAEVHAKARAVRNGDNG